MRAERPDVTEARRYFLESRDAAGTLARLPAYLRIARRGCAVPA